MQYLSGKSNGDPVISMTVDWVRAACRESDGIAASLAIVRQALDELLKCCAGGVCRTGTGERDTRGRGQRRLAT